MLLAFRTIGAPDALIHDESRAQKSQAVHSYCNDIGPNLRVYEEILLGPIKLNFIVAL